MKYSTPSIFIYLLAFGFFVSAEGTTLSAKQHTEPVFYSFQTDALAPLSAINKENSDEPEDEPEKVNVAPIDELKALIKTVEIPEESGGTLDDAQKAFLNEVRTNQRGPNFPKRNGPSKTGSLKKSSTEGPDTKGSQFLETWDEDHSLEIEKGGFSSNWLRLLEKSQGLQIDFREGEYKIDNVGEWFRQSVPTTETEAFFEEQTFEPVKMLMCRAALLIWADLKLKGSAAQIMYEADSASKTKGVVWAEASFEERLSHLLNLLRDPKNVEKYRPQSSPLKKIWTDALVKILNTTPGGRVSRLKLLQAFIADIEVSYQILPFAKTMDSHQRNYKNTFKNTMMSLLKSKYLYDDGLIRLLLKAYLIAIENKFTDLEGDYRSRLVTPGTDIKGLEETLIDKIKEVFSKNMQGSLRFRLIEAVSLIRNVQLKDEIPKQPAAPSPKTPTPYFSPKPNVLRPDNRAQKKGDLKSWIVVPLEPPKIPMTASEKLESVLKTAGKYLDQDNTLNKFIWHQKLSKDLQEFFGIPKVKISGFIEQNLNQVYRTLKKQRTPALTSIEIKQFVLDHLKFVLTSAAKIENIFPKAPTKTSSSINNGGFAPGISQISA